MQEAIKNFNKQFKYNPKIENQSSLKRKKKIIILGMGGSHLAADLIAGINEKYNIKIHSDYGLPKVDDKELNKSLIIASSYSGNTEEVIDGLEKALVQNLNCAVIATGGKLIKIAQENNLPYIQMPNDGIQPRSALGYSILALLKLMGQVEILVELKNLTKLNPAKFERSGKKLAKKLKGKVPIIYSSTHNRAVAYNWKIKFNETGKIPAFYNILPELNHNEMTGLDVKDSSRDLSANFYFIFLLDKEDDKRILKRFKILQKLYKKRGLPVRVIKMSGDGFTKIFSSLLLADWTALYIAKQYGLEAEQVPMVEEFKSQISSNK